MAWWFYALVSAVAAAATAILAKLGVSGVPSNLATAIRTTIVLGCAWAIVVTRGEQSALNQLTLRPVLYLALSGLATAASWLAYFKALALAPVSRVAPIDKLSLAFTIALSALVLGETISWKVGLGAALMVAGALITTL
jgi:bacterial/archaeal transporter family protein